MTQKGLVSVMMPAYNAEQYIEQAVASLLAQTHLEWELIIVNDGSTDRTARIVDQLADPRIRVIHQANGGEAVARNRALHAMQGEYVAFLDADDLYLPHHLEETVRYLQAHPHRGGVYTDGHYCNQVGQPLQTLSSRRRGPFEGQLFEETVRGSDVFGPPLCVVLRADVITRFNLRFDETITIGPDWVFFTEFADVATFGYLDQQTCLYRVHQTNISTRIGLRKRALELAKCRMRAIKMTNFRTCSVETQTAVFYELLVNLLRGHPERQNAVTQWTEFQALPRQQQARLLRLMASHTLVYECEHDAVQEWLRQSLELNPLDQHTRLLAGCLRLCPPLCRYLLRAKKRRETDPLAIPPFADLKQTVEQ